MFSNLFKRFNWIALILIYLVVVAGSFVRVTGSGMGCPDWPKCFGQWVPPTHITELPENYKEKYVEKRKNKVNRFSDIISFFGLKDVAENLKNDPNLIKEEDFNVTKTWTEYINRLLGFLAGNAVLIIFLWVFFVYRKNYLLFFLSLLNLFLMVFQGWFGSIVVASNLVPWTITIHLFFALLIIAIQLYIINLISDNQSKKIIVSKTIFNLIWISFVITFVQMFLGTQVREYIDELTRIGIGRENWGDFFGFTFFIHRSFSWLVLILLTYIFYKNEILYKYNIIRWLYLILVIELLSGVILAHINMIAYVQNAHLVFAVILFGILSMIVYKIKTQ